jgi:hypothetical protein
MKAARVLRFGPPNVITNDDHKAGLESNLDRWASS